MKYGMYYGPITPVQATDFMTMDVGQRLGKLYTYPETSILPEVTESYNGRTLAIEEDEWIPSDKYIELFLALDYAFGVCEGYRLLAAGSISGLHDIIGGNDNA